MKATAPRPPNDIDLGAPRTLVAISRIHLPENYHTDLPDPIHVKTDFATFDKTYRFEAGVITVERNITVLKKKVAKQDWKQYQQFTKDIGLDGESWIALIQPTKPMTILAEKAAPAKTDAKPGSIPIPGSKLPLSAPQADAKAAATPSTAVPDPDASVNDLMAKAREQLRSGDWPAAKLTLEAVKAKNPGEQYLWGMLGAIAQMQHNNDEAIADFRKELAQHPDNPGMVGALADLQNKTGDPVSAERTLESYLDRHPDELRLSRYLASIQASAEEYDRALKTLQAAADHNPDDRSLRLQMSNVLLRLHREDEAAAAAKSVLDGTEDPNLLNDAAYVLSETGRDLEYAEAASRKSIALLEEKSATISTAEVNSKAFAGASLLTASWDTLGWILFREGKPEQAAPLIRAAWLDSLHAEVGDHLGQVEQALHHNDEACAAYRLADAATDANTPAEIREHIHTGFTRLEASGAKPGPKNGVDALQKLRTYKLAHAGSLSGWGTFRLEITVDGVIESQQMSGEPKIAGIADAIKTVKFAELVPPGSKAHLLRSGVVSCSQTTGCEVVLVPDGGLRTEQQ